MNAPTSSRRNRNNNSKPRKPPTPAQREAKRRRNQRRRQRQNAKTTQPVQPNANQQVSGGNQPILQNSGARAPVKSKAGNRGIRRVDRALGGGSPASRLASFLGQRHYELLRFMLSPGERPAPCGFPDGYPTQTLVLNKRMDALSVASPFAAESGNWSFILLSLPSPEFPAVILYHDGILKNTDEIEWSILDGHTDPKWKYEVIGWDDVSPRVHYPRALLPALAGSGLTSNSLAYCANNTYVPADNAYAWVSAVATYLPEQVSGYRCLGNSVTLYQNANMTQNEGVLFMGQLNQEVQRAAFCNVTSTVCHAATNDVEPSFLTAQCNARAYILENLPRNLHTFTTLKHMTVDANKGAYIVNRMEGPPRFVEPFASRGLICYRPYGIDDNAVAVRIQQDVESVDGAHKAPGLIPAAMTMDVNLRPSLIVGTNMARGATFNMKLCAAFEATPTMEGHLTYTAMEPEPESARFQQVWEAAAGKIPVGGTAADNDFWESLKGVLSTVWDAVKFIAPIVMKFI